MKEIADNFTTKAGVWQGDEFSWFEQINSEKVVWSDERKKPQSERMKQGRAQRKAILSRYTFWGVFRVVSFWAHE